MSGNLNEVQAEVIRLQQQAYSKAHKKKRIKKAGDPSPATLQAGSCGPPQGPPATGRAPMRPVPLPDAEPEDIAVSFSNVTPAKKGTIPMLIGVAVVGTIVLTFVTFNVLPNLVGASNPAEPLAAATTANAEDALIDGANKVVAGARSALRTKPAGANSALVEDLTRSADHLANSAASMSSGELLQATVKVRHLTTQLTSPAKTASPPGPTGE